jgi:hypothetical protein
MIVDLQKASFDMYIWHIFFQTRLENRPEAKFFGRNWEKGLGIFLLANHSHLY